MAALRQRDPEVLAEALGNDMETASLALWPALADTLDTGRDAGALAAMISGSGPTCVFLAANGGYAHAIAEALNRSGTCRAALTATGPVPGARVV
jgi:4-diphosphocytidyl-2-C-methyl-D-erythritol kinase